VHLGAGSGLMRTIEQLVRGVWQPSTNELLRPTLYVSFTFDYYCCVFSTTKSCVLAAIAFAMEQKGGYLHLPHDIVFLGVVGMFVSNSLLYYQYVCSVLRLFQIECNVLWHHRPVRAI
jgi:hypothetical protein